MKLPVAALTVLALAACNSQDNAGANRMAAGNASASSGGPTTLRPGRWEMTIRFVSVDMPNAPADMAERLRAQPLPAPQTQINCMSQSEASDLVANFRRQVIQNQPNLSCDIGDQRFGGGQIRIAMNCRGLNGQPDQRMAMVGRYTDSSVQIAVSAASSTPIGNGTMQAVRIDSTMIGRRVGECNGTETD